MEIGLGDDPVGSKGPSASCLSWGFLLMISAATEGFPYTSIHIRSDLAQDIVGALGFLLAVFGVYYGFALGQAKKW